MSLSESKDCPDGDLTASLEKAVQNHDEDGVLVSEIGLYKCDNGHENWLS